MTQKSISVCIIGKPNAGKSSLLNKIIGHKISIVTPKVQTTRSMITGIVTIKDTQLILFDTPGIFEPSRQLERAMVRCAWSSLHGADLVLLIIDNLTLFDQKMIGIFEKLRSLNIKPIFLLNKIDVKEKQKSQNEDYLKEHFYNPDIFKISALSGTGVQELTDHLCMIAPPSPWLYEQDDITTQPMRFLASEITREQLFLTLREELPYNLTVQTESWNEDNSKPLSKLAPVEQVLEAYGAENRSVHKVREDSSLGATTQLSTGVEFQKRSNAITIRQIIVVSRENYKIMILGKNGTKIKEIGTLARLEMEKSFETKVHLFLFVKVRELWENMPEFYNYMGLKLTKEKK